MPCGSQTAFATCLQAMMRAHQVGYDVDRLRRMLADEAIAEGSWFTEPQIEEALGPLHLGIGATFE